MKTNKIILAAIGLALIGVGADSYAVGKSTAGTINPSLTITQTCTVDTTGVSGTFTGQNTGSTANGIPMAGGNITVSCPNVTYFIAADGGLHQAVAGNNQRRLAFGTTYIPYHLTLAGTTWGDKGANAKEVTYTDTMSTDPILPAAGQLGSPTTPETFAVLGVTDAALAGTEVAGAYTDTVNVTVVY